MSDLQEQYAELTAKYTELKNNLAAVNGVAQQGLVLSNWILDRFNQIPPDDSQLLKIVERAKQLLKIADKAGVIL